MRLAFLMALLLIKINVVISQDTLFVKGTILNGAGDPVANALVGVEGSFEIPVMTNDSGKFTVNAYTGKEWLSINSPRQYINKRVFLNNRTDLTIYLSSDEIESGDDIVKILNQNFYRHDLASSLATISTENLNQTPILSIDQYFQGRVAGMHVVNRSGDPGSGAVTLLRGVNSLNANNRPLYIVDGIPISSFGVFSSSIAGFEHNPLLGINLSDISSISIVKDPTITSAYGSKASNGVVFIETIVPSATETVIEVDFRFGYSLAPSTQIDQMNASQHRTLMSELLFSSGLQEQNIIERYPSLFLQKGDKRFIDYQHNTNWQDIIFSNSSFSNININMKGGDEIARYGLSFGYNNNNGTIKTTGYNSYNLRFVGLLNIFTWLKMNAGVSLGYSNFNLKESGKVSQTSPIMSALSKSPMLHYYQYDDEGEEILALAPVDEIGVSNPKAIIDNFEAKNTNFDFTAKIGFEAVLNKNLIFNSNFGLTYNLLEEQKFMPNLGMELYYDKEAYNVFQAANNSFSSFYNNTYLMFSKEIGTQHAFNSNTGINILSNKFEFDWALTKNSPANDKYRLLQDGTTNLNEIGGNNRVWNWFSFYENLTYTFRDKYIAMASFSIDGSSRIGDNAANTIKIGSYPFGLFYSAGLAWRLSQESFLKNSSRLEDLKVRLTYGRSGNDDIGEANAYNYYNAIKYRETTGLYPSVLQNDELTYETVSQINGGIDLALFGNRFIANLDFYESNTNNLLVYSPIEFYFGFDFRPENNGKMRNRGVELNLFFRIIDNSKFKWDIQTNYSSNKNEIVELKGDKLVTGVLGAEIVNMIGEQANSFYGYNFEGVYATSEEAEAAGLVNNKFLPYEAGDAIFTDYSGPNGSPDGIINDHDKIIAGNSMPKNVGGFSSTLTFKRWALNTFFQYAAGNKTFNYLRYQNENMIGLENQSTNVLNRWQYQGQETEVPRAILNDIIGNSSFSNRWIEDGSYLRMKNITLSYTIPGKFLNFRNARFYLTAYNVFSISKYLGYDPEFGYSQNPLNQGIDYGLTPQARQFVMGIKLGL